MKFQCVSCGAPRSGNENKFSSCEYCGSLPEVTLSHDSGLLSAAVKSEIKTRLQGIDDNSLDLVSETSLIVLFLLDGLTTVAEPRLTRLLATYPNDAGVIVLSTVSSLLERGISKTKIGVIDESISKLNLALSLDSDGTAQDVAFLLERIGADFYRKNGIKPNRKFLALAENLGGLVLHQNTLLSQLF